MGEHDPGELNALSVEPVRLLPPPTGTTDANLAQFAGRSIEGALNALNNLRRCQPADETIPITFPEGMPTPNVPAAYSLPGLDALRGRRTRAVLSQTEWDLFCETWLRWMTDHPDYKMSEDSDDLHTVCMETVYEMRVREAMMIYPELDGNDALNVSFRKKQRARQNLAARRVDRLGVGRSGQPSAINIAVLSGNVSNEKMIEHRHQHKPEIISAEDDEFLQKTANQPQ